MNYPNKQYVLAVKRGRQWKYFYGEKLGDLIEGRVKVGQEFWYAPLTKGLERIGRKTRAGRYEVIV